MTCQDARPLLSALIDEALPERDRAACAEHVAECTDCARELARLRITVDLVRGIGPVRAPAGFVDRVVAAARAETRRSRARHDVGRGWRFNVPLSAAAAVLVAVIGVSLYRLTPELRDATRHDAPPRSEAPAARPESPQGSSSVVASSAPASSATAALSKAETSSAPSAAPPVPAAPSTTPATPAPPPQAPPPAVAVAPPRMDAARTPASAPARPSERLAERETRAAAAAPSREVAAKATARPEPPAVAGAPAPPAAPAADRNVSAQMEGSLDRAAAHPVEATLTVTALPGIEGAVADVASRHRASLRGRAQEPDGVRLTLNVPADAYVELTRALQQIGRFTGPAEPPDVTHPIELILHIGL
jgi:anti-sigma factor RsiW